MNGGAEDVGEHGRVVSEIIALLVPRTVCFIVAEALRGVVAEFRHGREACSPTNRAVGFV